MNIHKALTASAMTLVLATPGLASAKSEWHDAGGEVGFTYYADHIKSTLTRAEVLRQLEAARKDGSLWYLQRGFALPVKSVGPGKTREEVQREVQNMTLDQRRQYGMIVGR